MPHLITQQYCLEMIPEFNDEGNLPEGIHNSSLQEFKERFCYNPKRAWLTDGLDLLLSNLTKAGCARVFIDGSFVTAKKIPGDYDLLWSLDVQHPERIDPVLLDCEPANKAMAEARYRGDIFPAEIMEGGSGKPFLEFFQTDKNTGSKKGIVEILLRR